MENEEKTYSSLDFSRLIDGISIDATGSLMGSWDVDLVERKLLWSKETREIHEVSESFKCTIEEAFQFYKDDQLALLREKFHTAISNNDRYDVRVVLTTQSGKQKWVRTVGIPVFENGICVRVYGLIQDISQEVILENIDRKQKEFFKKTFYEASTCMAISNLQAQFVLVNNSMINLLGYTANELLKFTFRDITHPDDLETSNSSFKDLLSGELKHYNVEKRYVDKAGTTIYAMLSVSVIKDEVGEPLYFLVQITNISKRIEATQKLQSLLNVTADQNKRLLNFAHIVSHNLRSHSGNLSMLMDLIQQQYPEIYSNEMMPYLGKAIGELSETIAHLQEVVSVHTSSADNIESLNLRFYIDKTVNVLTASILETKCNVEVVVSGNEYVNFIPAYLDSILLNLLSNAIKYRSDKRPPEIKIYTEKEDEYLVLAVADNGLGLDLEMHGKQLFGMYKTFHRNKNSRGVGLFLTKNQVEAMQGKITVESKPDSGATFKVYFKI
ncbi:sensor histidine kinase [Neptunitalea lumnitzerae]|uniref:histidine kinase n=1 Tax=Neptunitalea lumnitzerae TaxID=2965509 RepID=A0ABQ5MHQ8_9FLAO|nr:PAS domain S-box protein [Neptunitalea sp. Y10]GLB48462.1 histidine kinase [Neptunitalea sp. Y10]